MIRRKIGYRYKDYRKYEDTLHQPYDYTNDGLLKHIASHKITETNNSMLKMLLSYYEGSLLFLIHYVDRLHHFKNYCWKNR